MSKLDDFLADGVALPVLDDDVPDGSEIGTAAWLEALQEEQIAEHLETAADYREEGVGGIGVVKPMDYDDVEGERAEFDDDDDVVEGERRPYEDPEKVVFPPLPPGAGIAAGLIRGSRAWQALQPVPEVSEEVLRIRTFLAQKQARRKEGH